jgi:O-antigen/teichoic acid export membrane protein
LKQLVQRSPLPNNQHKHTVFDSGLAWTLAANTLVALSGMLTGSMLARLLGPDGRGSLAAIQNWPVLIQGLGALGITTAAAFYSGRDPKSAGSLLATAGITLAGWSIPLVLLGYVLMPKLLNAQSPEVVRYARIYLLIIPIQFIIAVSFSIFQGLREFRLWNILRLQGPLAWLIVTVVAWELNARQQFISVFYLYVMGCVACTFLFFALRRIPPPHRPDFTRLPDLLRYGVPTVLTTLPQILNLRLDQLLMAALLPPRVLGLYVVGVAWSGAFSMLLLSVSQVIFPHFAAIAEKDAQVATMKIVMRLSVITAVGVVSGSLLVTPLMLPWIFGYSYASAVPAALILVIASGVSSVNQIAGEALRGIGLPKWPMVAEFVGLVFTVPMLVWLLPRYQLMGAALASLLSYCAIIVTLFFLIARETSTSVASLVIPRREDFLTLQLKLSRFLTTAKLSFNSNLRRSGSQ